MLFYGSDVDVDVLCTGSALLFHQSTPCSSAVDVSHFGFLKLWGVF